MKKFLPGARRYPKYNPYLHYSIFLELKRDTVSLSVHCRAYFPYQLIIMISQWLYANGFLQLIVGCYIPGQENYLTKEGSDNKNEK